MGGAGHWVNVQICVGLIAEDFVKNALLEWKLLRRKKRRRKMAKYRKKPVVIEAFEYDGDDSVFCPRYPDGDKEGDY